MDLLIIGGGPGGYTAAIRAAQLGLSVGVVEREAILGGTCLRVGCIPSKAMLESSERYYETQHALAEHGVKVGGVELDLATMLRRKDQIVTTNGRGIDGLFKKHKITRYAGHGRIVAPGKVIVEPGDCPLLWSPRNKRGLSTSASQQGPNSPPSTSSSPPAASRQRSPASNSTATGSAPAPRPFRIREVPKHLVVVGAGYIGLELGSVWARLGAKVTVLEFLDRIFPGHR